MNPQPSGPQTILSLNKSFTSLVNVYIYMLAQVLFCGWILWDLWWQLPFPIISKLLVNYVGEAGYLGFDCPYTVLLVTLKMKSFNSSYFSSFIFHEKKIMRPGVMVFQIRHSVLLSIAIRVVNSQAWQSYSIEDLLCVQSSMMRSPWDLGVMYNQWQPWEVFANAFAWVRKFFCPSPWDSCLLPVSVK